MQITGDVMKWTPNTFIKALLKRGFVRLGDGFYSTVLNKPGSNRVVKVCGSLDGWSDYAVWAAEEGYAGNLAPKVYSLHVLPYSYGYFYVAVMERLAVKVHDLLAPHDAITAYQSIIENSVRFSDNAPEPWGEFVRKFSQRFPGIGNGITHDLHDGNFMLRIDGSLVLTDPIVSSNSRAGSRRYRSHSTGELKLAA
jgi:hypothetical protein